MAPPITISKIIVVDVNAQVLTATSGEYQNLDHVDHISTLTGAVIKSRGVLEGRHYSVAFHSGTSHEVIHGMKFVGRSSITGAYRFARP